MDEVSIRDGWIWAVQGKTDAKRPIEAVDKLKTVPSRIRRRKAGYRVHLTQPIATDDGRAFSAGMLRYEFDEAREKAGVAKKDFQTRDLRAKTSTDRPNRPATPSSQGQAETHHGSYD